TPLQALSLMNDPQFVEAARVFAQRVLAEGGESVEGRLIHAFRLAVARTPDQSELELLRELHEKQRARFAADPAHAEALVKSGLAPRPAGLDTVELATWTALCNVLLCLDETITRE